jgi:hypothetical protein
VPATEHHGALAPRAAEAELPVQPQKGKERDQEEWGKENPCDQEPEQEPDYPLAPMDTDPLAKAFPRGEYETQTDGRTGRQEKRQAKVKAYPAVRLDELIARHRPTSDGVG